MRDEYDTLDDIEEDEDDELCDEDIDDGENDFEYEPLDDEEEEDSEE